MKIELRIAIIAIISLSMIACQKGDLSSSAFDVAAAKEWYYGKFRKSPEYLEYNSGVNGKKSPNWKNGIYKKIGSMEIVEFPLIKVRKSVLLPLDGPPHENERIAAASLARVLFIKKGDGTIVVREAEYIPESKYLEEKNYDISDNSIWQFDKQYSGKLIIKEWSGKELSRRIFINGKYSGLSMIRKKNSRF